MKKIYINFFKKRFIFLFILLFVMCLSFGFSYSNFIINSSNHRAVEMFVGDLSYTIKINGTTTNTISVSPGHKVITVQVTSSNSVASYFKLSFQNNINLRAYYYEDETPYGYIAANGTKTFKVLISNIGSNSTNCVFGIDGGYATSELNKIVISNNYQEINKQLAPGDYINYSVSKNYNINGNYINHDMNYNIYSENTMWRILKVTSTGTIDFISDDDLYVAGNRLYYLNGNNDYTNATTLLNGLCNTLYTTSLTTQARNVSLDDINAFTTSNLTSSSSSVSSSVFTKPVYYELFINNSTNRSYYLSTKYSGSGQYGVLSINNGGVSKLKLYDSQMYTVSSKIRPIVTLSLDAAIIYDSSTNLWEIVNPGSEYVISYDKNALDTVDNMPASQIKKLNVDVNISTATPTRFNYEFNGWNTQPDGSGTDYAPGAVYSTNQSMILYAKWTLTGVTCSPGTYLPGNAASCSTCEAGYYCIGGSYSLSSTTQGRTQCGSGTSSLAGSETCYPQTGRLAETSIYGCDWINGEVGNACTSLNNSDGHLRAGVLLLQDAVMEIHFTLPQPATQVILSMYAYRQINATDAFKYHISVGEDTSYRNIHSTSSYEGTLTYSSSLYSNIRNDYTFDYTFLPNVTYYIYFYTSVRKALDFIKDSGTHSTALTYGLNTNAPLATLD